MIVPERTIKLTIEYDGTNYCGWQTQANGLSIQEVLETALARLLDEHVILRSSGRTDAGVHARGMVAVFSTRRSLPLAAYAQGLNNLIPPDIAIRCAEEIPSSFDPRADAIGKHYRYTILNDRCRSPLIRLYAWQVRGQLDIEAMREAAGQFVGEHDFSAFQATGSLTKTSIRNMASVDVAGGEGGLVIVDVCGSGFLRHMVRIMVGTLVEVGQGKMDSGMVRSLLRDGDRARSGATAPPQGLCLMEVFYRE